jgi:hypothetical protein
MWQGYMTLAFLGSIFGYDRLLRENPASVEADNIWIWVAIQLFTSLVAGGTAYKWFSEYSWLRKTAARDVGNRYVRRALGYAGVMIIGVLMALWLMLALILLK